MRTFIEEGSVVLQVDFEQAEHISDQSRVLFCCLAARQELAIQAVLALEVPARCADNVVERFNENLSIVELVAKVEEAELDGVNERTLWYLLALLHAQLKERHQKR